MKNSDEVVEKVLSGLRGVEAPAGLERRILKAARERVEARERAPWRSWPAMTPALMCGLALAVVGLLGVRHRLGSGKALPTVGVVRIMPAAGAEKEARRGMPVRLEAAGQPARRRVRRERVEESLALDETRAPSLVAPPLPLTGEERLLLRMVHRGDPEELAWLDPAERMRQDSEGRAEVQRFFRPSAVNPNDRP